MHMHMEKKHDVNEPGQNISKKKVVSAKKRAKFSSM